MKNIEAGVGAVLTQEQKAGREEVEEEVETREEEYTPMKNEMIFFLNDAPEYQISAVGEWQVNKVGEVIGDVEVYFLHILTGQRCESAWSCMVGMSEYNERSTEKWEALCGGIEELENLEEIVCDEKRFGL